MLSRSEAAKALGITTSHVRSLQARGQLRSERDKQGCHRFDQRELERVALQLRAGRRIASSDGALAAAVFGDLDAGYDFRALVRRHSQPPHVIRALVADWRDAGDALVPAQEARRVEELLRARFPDGWQWSELSRVVAELLDHQAVELGSAIWRG